MLGSHLRITLRNLLKQKGYTFINVAGLAVGIAVCTLILLWVRDELCYDRFHEKANRTYRILWDARLGDNEWTLAKTPLPLADVLREQFPEVEHVVRFTTATRTLRLEKDWVYEEKVLRVEKSFLDVFTVHFVSGDPKTALADPNGIILTEKAALRYFADQDPIGKSLEVNNGGVLRVTGVVKHFPPQSHFDFDFLVPLDATTYPESQRSWGSPPVYTYFVVKEGVAASQVDAKLIDFVNRTIIPGSPVAEGDDRYRLLLQPLTDIHLQSHVEMELAPNGNIVYVYLFSIIGAFILLLACINFINLATARATNRAKEVSVRKVLGAHRLQLVRQFLAEAFVYVILALILAAVLIELVLPAFNTFAGKQLEMNSAGSPFTLAILAGIAALVTLLAGAYPAFVLSSFWPVETLKGSSTFVPKRSWLRNGLVIAQFCVSIGLIVGTLVVSNQLHYVQSKQLGFDKQHVLIVEGSGNLGKQYVTFRERIEALPHVMAASAAQSLPGPGFDSQVFTPEQPANYEQSSVNYAYVDEHYAEVLGLNIIAGRNFSPDYPTDSSAFLINEAAAKALGWTNPIGKTLGMGDIRGPVVGVVGDFHYESLHTEIKPAIFPFIRWTPSNMAVRLRPGNATEAVAAVQQIWDEMVPQRPFSYSFLDQDYQKLYENEQRMAQVFSVFAVLALLIACLGLFGLASYVAVQRTKEIGIRKVMGASVYGIVFLLTREFARLVLIAFVLATPLAYLVMSRWLEDFAYRIEIGPDLFLLAGSLAVLIALLTVSYQAVRAAMADPVKSLRYE